MESPNSAIILLSSALLISLVVERLLEVINGLYRLIEIKNKGYRYWNLKAGRLQQRLQQFRSSDEDSNSVSTRTRALRSQIIKSFLSRFRAEQGPYSEVESISAEKIRKFSVKFAAKIIGVIIGVAIALVADIDMFKLIDQMLNPDKLLVYGEWAEFLHKVATGIAMGLGSGPLHKIILALEKAKKKRKNI